MEPDCPCLQHLSMQSPEIPPRQIDSHSTHRIILLGASNVTLGFPLLVKSLRQSFSSLDLYAAHGHGRSYCEWSYVLHRGLPSILDCGIWTALSRAPRTQHLWGVVTDVGNDLIYGVPPERLLACVERTLIRLQELGAAITFVRLPVERALQLTEREYRFVKRLLFPGPVIPWHQMQQWMIEVDERASALAAAHGAAVIPPELAWYGVDPIHIRYSQRPAAWQRILSSWPFDERPRVSRPSMDLLLRVWSQAPAVRSYWNRLQHRSQPTWKTSDGLSLWLY
jgi:hypothetical protein